MLAHKEGEKLNTLKAQHQTRYNPANRLKDEWFAQLSKKNAKEISTFRIRKD